MIIKYFQIENLKTREFKLYLLYGKNEGLQKEIIDKYFIKGFTGEINKYEENEILQSSELIIEQILNKSLFSNEKILIVSRASDKIMKFLEKIMEKDLNDIKIIIKSGSLERKSKLRNLFEKNKTLVAIPVYEDDTRVLLQIISQFISKNNLKISRESINLLIDRANGSRESLNLELEKILNYSISNKILEFETIKKITNLSENYSVNELADNILLKSNKNVIKILNENNYSEEDCILILRTLLIKSKRLLKIIEINNNIKNIDKVIMEIKPPVFWKEKESVKKQVNTWNFEDLKKKIYEINDIEALVKNNSRNSLNLVSNFIVNY